EPVDPGYYVIYVRGDDEALRRQLNDALRNGLHGGKESAIGQIYKKWNLWNADQDRLVEIANGPWPPTSSEEAPSRSARLRYFVPELVGAAGVTVVLSCLSMPLAMVAGLLVALGRLYGPRWLS